MFEPVYKVTQCFKQYAYALPARVSLNFLFSIKQVNFFFHSTILEQSIPVLWSSIISLKAPRFEAIVQVFTKLASTHLFSDFASLKIVEVKGAKLISIFEINTGSFL